jgi:hypothetical protein
VFKTDQKEKYFFTETGSVAEWLIRNNTVSVFKGFCLKAPLTSKHVDHCARIFSEVRTSTLKELLWHMKYNKVFYIPKEDAEKSYLMKYLSGIKHIDF